MAAYDIGQSNYVAHTRANGWHGLVTSATFTGTIIKRADYFLVDDHIGLGGTLANLRGYMEINGGKVIGMTTLTETGGRRKIAARLETLFTLKEKHGNELNQFGRQVLGHGTDCLTDIEAGYLYCFESVTAIAARMAEAATAARRQDLPIVRICPNPCPALNGTPFYPLYKP